jgi:hypothetical protein
MSEQLIPEPADSAEPFEPSPYDELVRSGLEKAEQSGFDLSQAITANYAPETADEVINARVQQVRIATEFISDELRLDRAFFDAPSNTILLVSIADSWVTNEEKVAQHGAYDSKLAAERTMLVDTAMVVAGEHMAEKLDPDAGMPDSREREDATDLARAEFLETTRDPELEAQITELIKTDGPGSLLEWQREQLGVTARDEAPFDVKVVKIGDKASLQDAGAIRQVPWPDYDLRETDRQAYDRQDAIAEQIEIENDAFAKPYEDAQREYDERFGAETGNLPPAWVDIDSKTGQKTLFIRGTDAFALLNQKEAGNFDDETADAARDAVAYVRHEFGRTQKSLLRGDRSQLGLIVEERKAEYISGDKHGYNDVKFLFDDLGAVTDSDLEGVLAESIKQEDPLTAFLSESSKTVGLRNTLLLMVNKPLPYDASPNTWKRFVDTGAVHRPGDVSTHDAMVRETIEARGDVPLRKRAAEWAGNMAIKHGLPGLEFANSEFMESYRSSNGLRRTTAYRHEAINHQIEQLRKQDAA